MEQDLATGVPGVVRWIEVGTRVVRVKGESRCFPAKGGWDASQTTKTLSEQVGPLCSVCWWEQPRQSFDEDLRSGALGRGNWRHQLLGVSTHYLGASTLDLGWFVLLHHGKQGSSLSFSVSSVPGGRIWPETHRGGVEDWVRGNPFLGHFYLPQGPQLYLFYIRVLCKILF